MPNPLAATPDYASNPLAAGTGPAPSITAAQPPTQATAYSFNANAAQAWLNHQRTMAVHLGLADPETGLPTKAGLISAAQQWAQSIQPGTIRGSGTPPLTQAMVGAAEKRGPSMPSATLYHGTSPEGLEAIQRDGYIRGPAFFSPKRDAALSYAQGDPNLVLKVDVPEEKLLIDHDLPGGALMSVEDSNGYTGNADWTIKEYLRNGYSVAVPDDFPIAEAPRK